MATGSFNVPGFRQLTNIAGVNPQGINPNMGGLDEFGFGNPEFSQFTSGSTDIFGRPVFYGQQEGDAQGDIRMFLQNDAGQFRNIGIGGYGAFQFNDAVPGSNSDVIGDPGTVPAQPPPPDAPAQDPDGDPPLPGQPLPPPAGQILPPDPVLTDPNQIPATGGPGDPDGPAPPPTTVDDLLTGDGGDGGGGGGGVFDQTLFLNSFEQGKGYFPAAIYGTVPSTAFANLVATGRGPSTVGVDLTGVTSQNDFIARLQQSPPEPGLPPTDPNFNIPMGVRWYNETFIPSLSEIGHSAINFDPNTQDPDAPGFDINSGAIGNVDLTEALLGGLFGGSTSISGIFDALGGALGSALGPAETRLSSLSDLIPSGLTDTLAGIEGFTAPSAFDTGSPFMGNVQSINDLLFGPSGQGGISGFQMPQGLTDLQNVGSFAGTLGELEKITNQAPLAGDALDELDVPDLSGLLTNLQSISPNVLAAEGALGGLTPGANVVSQIMADLLGIPQAAIDAKAGITPLEATDAISGTFGADLDKLVTGAVSPLEATDVGFEDDFGTRLRNLVRGRIPGLEAGDINFARDLGTDLRDDAAALIPELGAGDFDLASGTGQGIIDKLGTLGLGAGDFNVSPHLMEGLRSAGKLPALGLGTGDFDVTAGTGEDILGALRPDLALGLGDFGDLSNIAPGLLSLIRPDLALDAGDFTVAPGTGDRLVSGLGALDASGAFTAGDTAAVGQRLLSDLGAIDADGNLTITDPTTLGTRLLSELGTVGADGQMTLTDPAAVGGRLLTELGLVGADGAFTVTDPAAIGQRLLSELGTVGADGQLKLTDQTNTQDRLLRELGGIEAGGAFQVGDTAGVGQRLLGELGVLDAGGNLTLTDPAAVGQRLLSSLGTVGADGNVSLTNIPQTQQDMLTQLGIITADGQLQISDPTALGNRLLGDLGDVEAGGQLQIGDTAGTGQRLLEDLGGVEAGGSFTLGDTGATADRLRTALGDVGVGADQFKIGDKVATADKLRTDLGDIDFDTPQGLIDAVGLAGGLGPLLTALEGREPLSIPGLDTEVGKVGALGSDLTGLEGRDALAIPGLGTAQGAVDKLGLGLGTAQGAVDKLGLDLNAFGDREDFSIPGFTDVNDQVGKLDELLQQISGRPKLSVTGLEGSLGDARELSGLINALSEADLSGPGGQDLITDLLQQITDTIGDNFPWDAVGTGGGGGDGTGEEPGDGTGTGGLNVGSFLDDLAGIVEGGFGATPKTSDELREDPVTASILADLKAKQGKDEKQLLTDLNRFGVLRSGDTARMLPEFRSLQTRDELSALADAATRDEQARQFGTTSGISLGNLLSGREQEGDQFMLDLIGAAIAANDPELGGNFGFLSDWLMGKAGVPDQVRSSFADVAGANGASFSFTDPAGSVTPSNPNTSPGAAASVEAFLKGANLNLFGTFSISGDKLIHDITGAPVATYNYQTNEWEGM